MAFGCCLQVVVVVACLDLDHFGLILLVVCRLWLLLLAWIAGNMGGGC